MAANVLFKLLTRAQYDGLSTVDPGTLYRVQEVGGGESFYQGTNKLDRNDLDVSEIALATVSGSILSISGIVETDGKIAKGSSSVTLAKVAMTGDSADVSYDHTTSGLSASTVKAAIDEVAAASSGGVSSKTIYITETSGESADSFSKKYGIYQGASGSAASPVAGEKVADIAIPKDMVVSEGSVVDITYSAGKLYDGADDVTSIIMGSVTPTSADAGKYIKLVIANATSDKLYIKAGDLVDVYTAAQNAAEVQVAIDASTNVISASIVKIDAAKVEYKAESAPSAGDAETVKQALTRMDGSDSTDGSMRKIAKDAATAAVNALDTVSDVTIASETSGVVTLTAGVKEVDGVIAKGTGTDIVLAKLATTAKAEDADYDNLTSGLTATDVQAAIDEIAGTAGSAVQSVTEGSTNGTISVDNVDISVHGLGSAAYTESSDYDVAGAAADVLGTNADTATDNTVYGAKAYADSVVGNALTWQTIS